MNPLISSNEELRSFVANVVTEIDDERLLFDRMAPFLEQAQRMVEINFLGADDFDMSDGTRNCAAALVFNIAYYNAIPSLDLVLTPNGFGIVSTNTIAPASKERIARLRDELLEQRSELQISLVERLLSELSWTECPVAAPYTSTLMYGLHAAKPFMKDNETILDTFLRILPLATAFEETLAAEFLGHNLLDFLRNKCYSSEPIDYDNALLLRHLQMAENRWLAAYARTRPRPQASKSEVWATVSHIIARLEDFPEAYAIYQSEMLPLLEKAAEERFPTKSGGCWL